MVAGLNQIPRVATGYIVDHFQNKSEQRRIEIENKKFQRVKKLLESKTQKSTSNTKPSEGLTTEFLQGESIEQLGRRKWKEYENHIEKLSETASPSQIKRALREIEQNIRIYPCTECRENAINNLETFPIVNESVKTKLDAKKRLCGFHNIVRDMLGKPIEIKCEQIT